MFVCVLGSSPLLYILIGVIAGVIIIFLFTLIIIKYKSSYKKSKTGKYPHQNKSYLLYYIHPKIQFIMQYTHNIQVELGFAA